MLNLSSKFSSNRLSSISALQGILIEGDKNKLNFYSTNLSLFFHGSIKAESTTPFKIIVEPKKIVEFLSLLKEEALEVEIKENMITLIQGKTTGSFSLIKQADFPLPPAVKEEERKIKTGFLAKNLPLVLFSAAHDEARPALTGVNFLELEDQLCLVSTDGFRLSLVKTKKTEEFPNVLVPAEFLGEVVRQFKGEEEVFFNYSKEEKIIVFRVGENRFYSRLIEGDFPPFERVIPAEKKTTVTLNKDELLRNIKVISIFAREASNIIVCEFGKNELSLKPKTETGEENRAKQEINLEGEPQKVAFNYRFLLDFLNNCSEQELTIEILRPDAPVVFKTEKNKEFLHIIMPVRLQE